MENNEDNVERAIVWDDRKKIAKARISENYELTGEKVKELFEEFKKQITINEMRTKELKKELDDIKVADTPELKELARQLTLIGKLGQKEKLEVEMLILEADLKKLKTGKNFYGTIIDKVV